MASSSSFLFKKNNLPLEEKVREILIATGNKPSNKNIQIVIDTLRNTVALDKG
jgi:uncharacterized protein YneF (UPF0154 family)